MGLAGCVTEDPGPQQPLRIALHGDPSSLDPHLQSESIAQTLLGNVYETLVGFDVNMGLVPSLAERWENPDDLVWRFHLRRGVKFHDGRSLTSADVAFSLDRARTHPRSKIASYLVAIDEVRVLDELTLELITAQPYPILLNKLTFVWIVPQGSAGDISRPVGSGPYRFVAFEPGQRLQLAAFADHWRAAPPVPAVEFLFIAEPAERVRRLLSGDVDFINTLSPDDVAAVEAHPELRVESRSSVTVTYLQMDPAAAPFADPRVRRAIDLAFDRRALVEKLLRGQGQPLGQMVSPNVFGYQPQLLPVAQDLEQARRLLAAAGYPDGLDLTLEYRQGRDLEPVGSQLAAAGIRVELVPRPWGEMYPRLQSGAVAFYFGGWVCSMGDASDLLDQKVHTRDLARGYGVSNSNRYSNPVLDALIEDGVARLSMVERRAILQRALEILAEDRVFIPLYSAFGLYGLRREIEWTPRQDERINAFEMRR